MDAELIRHLWDRERGRLVQEQLQDANRALDGGDGPTHRSPLPLAAALSEPALGGEAQALFEADAVGGDDPDRLNLHLARPQVAPDEAGRLGHRRQLPERRRA